MLGDVAAVHDATNEAPDTPRADMPEKVGGVSTIVADVGVDCLTPSGVKISAPVVSIAAEVGCKVILRAKIFPILRFLQ